MPTWVALTYGFRRKQFGDSDVFQCVFALTDAPGGSQSYRPCGFYLCFEIGEYMRDCLEAADWPPELFSLLDIADCEIEYATGAATVAGGNDRALGLQA